MIEFFKQKICKEYKKCVTLHRFNQEPPLETQVESEGICKNAIEAAMLLPDTGWS